jgi:SagB-type dehydrogenase family enzyme
MMGQARLDYMKDSAWKRGTAKKIDNLPPFELPYAKDAVLIDLVDPDVLPDAQVNFLEMIEVRSTLRQYDDTKELSNKELSYLLWCTQGVKMVMQTKTIRNVPSAGGRNALETFLYIRRVEGIKPGLYRFLPLEHKLLLVSDAEDIEEKICSQFSTVGVANNAAVVFLWTAVYERMDCMFGERAYRYIYLDAGHVCQNLYLAAQTMHIKVCALGAFDDENTKKLKD